MTPLASESHHIQGLIRYGYRNLCSARFLLLTLPEDRARARAWVAAIADRVQTAAAAPKCRAVNLAFTHSGLARLGLDEAALYTTAGEFQEGLAGSPYRSELLGDVGTSAPCAWQWGAPSERLDAVLLLYARDAAALQQLASEENTRLRRFDVRARELTALTLSNDGPTLREHFGFLDGFAQPSVRGWDEADVAENTVRPGEFVLGYENEYGQIPDSPHVSLWNERLGGTDFGRNGSYMVLRQLEQDVAGFWRCLLARTGGDHAAAIEMAAKMVGRWPNGTPVTLSERGEQPAWSERPFGYAERDMDGLRCPLGAHVRRANPRDGLPGGSPKDSVAIVKRHRMLRRGRPYARPETEPLEPSRLLAELESPQQSAGERGLYFICVNANIARQFEFIQQDWLNSPGFVRGEQDPLCGDRVCAPPTQHFSIPDQPVRRRVSDLARFIHVRGGAYFFLPSIPALHYLAEGR